MLKPLTIWLTILVICISCSNINTPENELKHTSTLSVISAFKTDIPEPSGLCTINSNGHYYAISDRPTNTIYKIDSLGQIISEIAVEASDIEGITINSNDSTIWLVDEAESKVICLNRFGQYLNLYNVDYEQVLPNNGLEGITFNSTNQHFYLITEKNPSLLLKWMPGEGIINSFELDFADDYSAITYSYNKNMLWITSDESAKLFLCTLEGEVVSSFDLPMNTIEGMVPTNKPNEFVGISDGDSKLYKFGLSAIIN